MKIDVHNHIGFDPMNWENRSYIDLLEEMEKAGLDKAIVFPFTTNPNVVEQNSFVKKAIDKKGDSLIGFFTMNPDIPEMVDLMLEYVDEGFLGVVTDPRFGIGHGGKRFHELVEIAYFLDIPVFLHSDDKDTTMVPIRPLESLLVKYSKVTFILSSTYYDSIGIAERHNNVLLETSVFELSQDLERTIEPIGTHRIIMGSNTPHGMIKREIDKINISKVLTDFQKSLILGKNILRVLDIC